MSVRGGEYCERLERRDRRSQNGKATPAGFEGTHNATPHTEPRQAIPAADQSDSQSCMVPSALCLLQPYHSAVNKVKRTITNRASFAAEKPKSPTRHATEQVVGTREIQRPLEGVLMSALCCMLIKLEEILAKVSCCCREPPTTSMTASATATHSLLISLIHHFVFTATG